jgi:hypothetical protein
MRRVDGGFFASFTVGRIGRGAKFPPQFGQTPLSLFSTQSRQNVHSNVQIIASVADGGRSLSQHSQLGRNSSMSSPRIPYVVLSMDHPDHSASPAAAPPPSQPPRWPCQQVARVSEKTQCASLIAPYSGLHQENLPRHPTVQSR